MTPLIRQQILAEYMLSAEPQVRSSLTYGEFLFSDRTGIATTNPLTWKPPGDIQNKLLSPNKKAMLMLEQTGNVKIYTGDFDNNGNASKPTNLIFNSTTLLNNGAFIGVANAPYSLGFYNSPGFIPKASMNLWSLKQNKSVGLFGEFNFVFDPNNLKMTLTDSGNLDVYNGEQLIWSTNSSGSQTIPETSGSSQTPGAPPVAPPPPPPKPPATPPPATQPPVNNPLIGPGTSNPLTPTNEKSLFSNPVVLAGLAFAAYKFLSK
jgi:hypothetical protein